MSTEPIDGEERRPHLRAVPAVPGEQLEPAESAVVYADVTGDRKPILPAWLSSIEAVREHGRRQAGKAKHTALYHGLRSPAYLGQAAVWSVVGLARLSGRWIRWALFPVPVEVWADAISDGHRAWQRAHAVHKETVKVRVAVSVAGAGVLAAGGWLAWEHAPWWALAAGGAVALPLLARAGRPEGRRIVSPAHVPPVYEALSQDVIVRALGSLGLAGINQWIREGREIAFASPVRQDGPGWRAEIDLPYGVTAAQVIDKREQLASGLRRPLGAVWPEPVVTEHAGRLEMWVGREDVSKRKLAAWPLLKTGQVDVFAPVPFGTDVRGRTVKAPLIAHNWLIGSMPGNGKTGAVRTLACAAALDPLAELWIHELKGTGDLDALEQVSHRFVSGIDEESIAYAAESLRLLREEVERRSPRLKALPAQVCPEKRVTRAIAEKASLRLRPLVCFVDECQNLFAHPKHGKQAGADAEYIIKLGRALGVVLVLATQRPDKDSLPTGVSGNVSQRFCLYVAGQVENDMILGTSAYKNGVRATLFRPEVDAGLGYLKGATPTPKVVKAYYLQVPAAQAVAARARAARERAGTLTGAALGEPSGPGRDVLADALAAMGAETGLHWAVLAERLAERFPDRWAGASAEAVSAQLRALGVRSVQVNRGGENKQGCRAADVEALQA